MSTRIYGSLARIADFSNSNFDVQALPRSEWATGDYVEGEVTGTPSELYQVEDRDGHMVRVEPGDWTIGALGDRAATLEGVGSWRDVSEDGVMHALTSAGLFGRYTSISQLIPEPLQLSYRGHLCRNGEKVTMSQFALRSGSSTFSVPTILLVGTSMSAGKTTTGRREADRRRSLPRYPELSQNRRDRNLRFRRRRPAVHGRSRRCFSKRNSTAPEHDQ